MNQQHVGQKKPLLLLWALLGGTLLWAGWPVSPFPFLLFIALVPILIIEDQLSTRKVKKSKRKLFGLTYLAFFIWNTSTTWWVWNSTNVGAVAMILANSLLMTLPIMLFHYTKKFGGDLMGYLGLICYWLAFEYLHLNWDLSWPWLTLGNGLAMYPRWIQWYEYTGVFGGSLWIWILNLGIFFTFFRYQLFKLNVKSLYYSIGILIIPIFGSYLIYWNYEEKGEEVEVVVMQPNIDPYTEKFANSKHFIPFEEQVEKFLKLSKKNLEDQTSFLVWPESAIDNLFNEEYMDRYPILDTIVAFKNQYSNLSLLTGITSYSIYRNDLEVTPTARYREDIGYYDVFNTALYFGDNGLRVTYHKSKLVPGVEIMPYPQVFNVVSELVFDLGGTSGALGRQKERTVFFNQDSIGVAPAICYESIYGEFMGKFIQNGANLIFIITNDGWWGDTPGHRQHLHYAKLRAIELRRSIARSANTGISAFIDQKGNIYDATEYWEQDVISKEIKASEAMTFYSTYGDYLARTATWLSLFIFLGAFVKRKIKR